MSSIELNGRTYVFDENAPIDISIPLRFDGPQPNAYGVEPATSAACEYGALVGDTRRGGSCNFERVTFIPHCNGTHTECIGHITKERISVRECLKDVLIPALLVSIDPTSIGDDHMIGDGALSAAGIEPRAGLKADALIVRTLPNDDSKLSRRYDETSLPAYFSADAMEMIVAFGFKHLLVDLPSIDRLYDEGKLINHRIFWNVEQGGFQTNSASRVNSTITELIYVPNEIADGAYLLNLQIAPFEADAAPSRPMLFRIR
jgi:arylformamidase